jgi:hypothetical protein
VTLSDIGSEPGSAAENPELGSAIENHEPGSAAEMDAAAENPGSAAENNQAASAVENPEPGSAVENHQPGSAAGPETAAEHHELGPTAGPEAAAEHHDLDQDERAELERLRAETAETHEHEAAPAPRRRHSWRSPVSVVLILLGCILAPVAVIGSWASLEVSNTDRYVATVEPLIHDPAIQNYLTDQITTQITSRINVTGVVNQAAAQLNSKGLTRISSLLSQFGPQISSAVNSFIYSTVHSAVSSSQFATIWVTVNRITHQQLVKVLSGQGSTSISIRNGQITLDLGPFISAAKTDLIAHGFKLASQIPPVHPTVVLFQANDLGKAQTLYRLIKAARIVLIVLVLLLLAAGVWVARNHRRALVGAGLGLAASMLVLGIGLNIGRGIYLSSVPAKTFPTDAAAAAYDALVHFIRETLRVVLIVGLVVAIGAFFTGPSRAAISTRSWLKSGPEWIRHYGERRGVSTGPVGQWTYLHRRGLRIGAVALFALIFVFWGEPTVLVVIVLVILLLVVLALIELIGRPIAEPEAAKEPEVASHT